MSKLSQKTAIVTGGGKGIGQAISRRFASGTESKLAQDFERMDRILDGEPPEYKGEEVHVTLNDLHECWFSTGDAFCKAILCLYAYQRPRSFDDGGLVTLDNSWLKVARSRNYHHFFPKKHLRTAKVEDWEANSILNITLVSADLNKRRIRAKAPSEYMEEFKKSNDELDATMRTHLIDDLDAFGVWDDDYPTFLEKRGKRVLKEIEKRLHPNLD